MPIPRSSYVPIPAVIPRRVADTRTLGALLQRQGENALQFELQKGQSAAQAWQQLGKLFSSYAQGTREDEANASALATRKQEKDAADQLKRDELAERKAEREEAGRAKREIETRQRTDAAAKVGDSVAESVGYGPMSEPQMDQVLASPAQAGRARYSFGPGTADGPELMPTREQVEDQQFRDAVEAKGGMVSPKGQAIMPPKEPVAPREPNPTEASLAMMAANGDKGAIRALEILARQKAAGREPKAPPAPPKMAAGTADKVAMAQTSLAVLDRIEGLLNEKQGDGSMRFRDEMMGPWAGRYNKMERGAPSVIGAVLPDAPKGFEDFAAESATLKNQVIQAITGAAVGVQEQGRILDQIPTETDSPSNWKAKAKATRKNLQELMANQIRMGTGAQGPLVDGTTVSVDIPGAPVNPFRKK